MMGMWIRGRWTAFLGGPLWTDVTTFAAAVEIGSVEGLFAAGLDSEMGLGVERGIIVRAFKDI